MLLLSCYDSDADMMLEEEAVERVLSCRYSGQSTVFNIPGASESCIDMYKPGIRCLKLASVVRLCPHPLRSHADLSWACSTVATTRRFHRQQRFSFEQLTPHKDDLCSHTALAVGLNMKCRQ
jgi:hypothetical protein